MPSSPSAQGLRLRQEISLGYKQIKGQRMFLWGFQARFLHTFGIF